MGVTERNHSFAGIAGAQCTCGEGTEGSVPRVCVHVHRRSMGVVERINP